MQRLTRLRGRFGAVLSVSPTTALPWGPITISWSGFQSGHKIWVDFLSGPPEFCSKYPHTVFRLCIFDPATGTYVDTASGSVDTVAPYNEGTYTWQARQEGTGLRSNIVTFVIGVPAVPNLILQNLRFPNITVSPIGAKAGDPVEFSWEVLNIGGNTDYWMWTKLVDTDLGTVIFIDKFKLSAGSGTRSNPTFTMPNRHPWNLELSTGYTDPITGKDITTQSANLGISLYVPWNISVTDISTNRGVANAKVCLFWGGGGILPPEQANYTKYTKKNGAAAFEVPFALYRVGIFASGYESAHDPHNPPPEWLNVWTCWGAGTAGYDYNFPVTPPPTPEPSGKVTSIKVEDVARGLEFNWANGVWDSKPTVKVGSKTLIVGVVFTNMGNVAGTVDMTMIDDLDAVLGSRSVALNPGESFTLRPYPVDMPNRSYSIECVATP